MIEPDARARPSRALIAGVVVFFVVDALIAARIVIRRYEPLGATGGSLETGWVATLPPGSFQILHRDGARTSFWLDLNNGGSWGVTILGIADQSPARARAIRIEAIDAPAGPFALRGGATMRVTFVARIVGCAEAGEPEALVGVPVRYRVLGITETMTVALPWALRVSGAPTCPVAA